MTDSPAIRTETLQVRRTALVAMRGPEPGASPPPVLIAMRLIEEAVMLINSLWPAAGPTCAARS